jgi:PKD repeat protein
VTYNDGATDSATVTVHIDEVIVINLPPTIILNAPSSGQVGEGLTFDASQSFDPEGTALSWAWNFGDGTTTTGEVVTHSYTQAGQFTLTLVVTDATGQYYQSVVTLTIS